MKLLAAVAAPVAALVAALVASFTLAGCATGQGPKKYTHVPREEKCKPTSEKKVAALFDRWNDSLQSGDPHKVAANYAEDALLLPDVTNQPRLTPAEIEEYFEQFLPEEPSGKIDLRRIYLGCNVAVDAGLVTFTFGRTGQMVPIRYSFTYRWDGEQWLITSHHASPLPAQE
jgi:uncharacterized protein (TIGR02246 family)